MTAAPLNQLTLGILASTRKPDERRLPIHPLHFERIEPELRQRIILEEGYGERFGVSDVHLASLVGRLASREELIADADVVLLPKPQPEDLAELRDGQVLWGWPHCVQDRAITQLAIDKKLTLIAFEAMNTGPVTAASGFTSSTRTTSWPATAQSFTPWP
ncbi:N(5)-(carboxyethyl)ornithine synthase [Arthrobacter sp. Hiyo6]|nr:N(5)-(carboxyethyl)ornithine synthase [Arthrobacter sp. Hiyo6]